MKNFKADTHVLGSREGYKTLVMSKGVLPEERIQLESLRYGQTDDDSFLLSLDHSPSAIGRPLRSGRYAVTRCFMGGRDTAGRLTVKFVSLIFSEEDWVRVVSRNVPALLAQPRFWMQAQEDGAVINGSLPELEWSDDTKVAVTELLSGFAGLTDKEILGLDDTPVHNLNVQLLPTLLPRSDRAELRWGIRVLSAGAGLKVGTYPPVADLSSRKKLVSLQQISLEPAPYAIAINHFWSGEPLPPRSFIDAAPSISSFQNGAEISEPLPTNAGGVRVNKVPKIAYAALSVLAAAVLLGYTVISLRSNKSGDTIDKGNQIAETRSDIAETKDERAPIASTFSVDEAIVSGEGDEITEVPVVESSPTQFPEEDAGLTPNEREAAVLVKQFTSAESWGEREIQEWVSRARALYHVQQIPGYSESLAKALRALDWMSEAVELSNRVWARVRADYSGPSLEALSDSDLRRAVHQMRVDASEIWSHLHDPRISGFKGLSVSGLHLLLGVINSTVAHSYEILDYRALAAEELKRAALEAQKANARSGTDDLERVIEEARNFARLGANAGGIDDYMQAPSVDVLERWWSVLDYAAIPEIRERSIISDRRKARGWAIRAMRWRFEALKYQIENSANVNGQVELVSEINRLIVIHGRIEPKRDQDEEISQQKFDDFMKELDR